MSNENIAVKPLAILISLMIKYPGGYTRYTLQNQPLIYILILCIKSKKPLQRHQNDRKKNMYVDMNA